MRHRKTFYYHYDDIYALLKWMLEQEAIDVVKQFDLVVNAEEAIRFVMNYVEENKHIINCVYDSMGHAEIKRFLFTDMFGVARNMIDTAERMLGLTVDEPFKNYLSCFYTEATAGMLVDWIKNNTPQDKEELLSDILLIYRESIPCILRAKAEEHAAPVQTKI